MVGWFWAQAIAKRKVSQVDLRRREDEARKDDEENQRKAILRSRFLERQRLIDSVDRHRAALVRNLDRSIKENDYGIVTEDKSDEALDEFFASINLDVDVLRFDDARNVTLEQLEWIKTEARAQGFDEINLPFDGHAFEAWVAEALEGFGWTSKVTKGSGDQGIDVIAEKDGKKLGLQCKLYSNAVGNKAVQEAHTGKAFHMLDEVGVLTNAEFTRSAKDLAQVTGVLLLSHRDIPNLEKILLEVSK